MPTILLSLWLLVSAFAAWGQPAGKGLKITPLTGDFYIYTTYKTIGDYPFPSNSMYLVTTTGIVLFDTPWDTAQFQPLLDSLQRRHRQKVIACIATHFHDDRTAGLEFFNRKGIKTYSSKQTRELCKQKGEKQAAGYFIADTTFTFGNHTFRTYYPGKGHSPDNIVIWFGKQKILYGGCFVKSTENSGLGNVADADVQEWEHSVRRTVKQFPAPKFVIPGHFGWAGKNALQHTLRLLERENEKARTKTAKKLPENLAK